jgi:penicillin-insensitive murein endopeptidase
MKGSLRVAGGVCLAVFVGAGSVAAAAEFGTDARSGDSRIDFDALALHLGALAEAAREERVSIARVIFDPPYQPVLRRAASWKGLDAAVPLSPSASWVRHDEHYHVDFAVPCER